MEWAKPLLMLSVVLVGCAAAPAPSQTVPTPTQGGASPDFSLLPPGSPHRPDKVILSDAEWRQKLTPDQYAILRAEGTEAAFCGVFYDNHKTGIYYCAGCGNPVFESNAKFDSGTGWPSFFQPAYKGAVWTRVDRSYGMVREEVLCARCDSHLGHVFNDGPTDKGGLRFCINSPALVFKEIKSGPFPEFDELGNEKKPEAPASTQPSSSSSQSQPPASSRPAAP